MQSSTVVGSTGHQTPVQLKWMFINTCTPSVSINHCYQVHFRQNKNYSIYIDSDGIWQKKNGEAGGLSFWSSGAGVAVKYLVKVKVGASALQWWATTGGYWWCLGGSCCGLYLWWLWCDQSPMETDLVHLALQPYLALYSSYNSSQCTTNDKSTRPST